MTDAKQDTRKPFSPKQRRLLQPDLRKNLF